MLFQALKYINHFFSSKHGGHGVHSPFVYSFIKNVLEADGDFYDFKKIENTRNNLLQNNNTITINDLGAGSRKNKSNTRKINEIAKTSLKPANQARLLFRTANYFSPENIIELGTSLGISTLYLSSAVKNANIYTIEGDKKISNLAQKVFNTFKAKNIKLINGNFDKELPKLLKQGISPDFVYIDGNHTYDATIKYFNMLLPYVNSKSVIIFDDIYWSKSMYNAWKQITGNEKVNISIDLFWFGIIFFEKNTPKQHFKLFF